MSNKINQPEDPLESRPHIRLGPLGPLGPLVNRDSFLKAVNTVRETRIKNMVLRVHPGMTDEEKDAVIQNFVAKVFTSSLLFDPDTGPGDKP